MHKSRRLIRLALACAILPLAACSTPTAVVDTGVNSFRPIQYSRRDTCETQRAAAEHNSVYDTLKTGRPVTYRAPCEAEKGRAPVAAPVATRAQERAGAIERESDFHSLAFPPRRPPAEVDRERAPRVGSL